MAELLIIGGIAVTSAVVGGYFVKRRNKKILEAKVFNKPLTDFKLKHLEPNHGIPSPVQWIFQAIEERGLSEPNLFQIEGIEDQLQEIAKNVNKDKTLLNKYLSSEPINIVSGLLLYFFRELPTSVFPQHLFPEVINVEKTSTSQEDWIKKSQGVLEKVPIRNQCLIQRLMGLLNSLRASPDVETQARTNAKLFSPALFFSQNFELAQLLNTEAQSVQEFVRNLILHYEPVFRSNPNSNQNMS